MSLHDAVRFGIACGAARGHDARNATLPTRRCGAIIFADYRVIRSAREGMGPKEQEISPLYSVANNLKKAGWSLGYVSAVDSGPDRRAFIRLGQPLLLRESHRR
jgi:hypothetical protein